MSATKVKAPKEKLTTRDAVDLLVGLEQAIDDNIDEIELNGGALPEWMAAMFDEVNAAIADRVDALAFKVDEFTGKAAAAKATKDRAARRESVWNNAVKAIKAYALRQVERSGGTRLEGRSAVLRIQRNGQPSVELTAPPETQNDLMLGIFESFYEKDDVAEPVPHPLAKYISVQRVATLDKKALATAYEARELELEQESELLGEADFGDVELARFADYSANALERGAADPDAEAKACVLVEMRSDYVNRQLAAEFPGVRCTRGHHLRID